MVTARNFKEVLKLPCVVVEDPKIIFFRIPKAASTSIHKGYFRENYVTLNAKTNSKGFRSWLKNVTFDWFEEAFKFTFVRNPFDRFVSLYVYFTTYTPKFKGSPLADRWKRDGDPVPTFDEFVRRFDVICDKREDIRNHSMPQHLFAFYEGNPFVDFIGRFEHLERDIKHIQRRHSLKEYKLKHLMSTVHDHYSSFYDEEARSKVGKIYKKDLDYFNYRFHDIAIIDS